MARWVLQSLVVLCIFILITALTSLSINSSLTSPTIQLYPAAPFPSSLQCHIHIQKRIQSILSPYFTNKKKIAIVDPATHENVGDAMIWQGQIDLIRSLGFEVAYTCGKCQDHPGVMQDCNTDYMFQSDVKASDWLIVAQGGGNWGNVWISPHECRRKRFEMFSKVGFDILQMPVSVKFVNKSVANQLDPRFARQAERSLRMEPIFWNKIANLKGLIGNITVSCRQEDSCDYLQEHYPMIPIKAVPDIAFMMGRVSGDYGPPVVDVLVMLRMDLESKLVGKFQLSQVKSYLTEKGFSVHVTDWGDVVQLHKKTVPHDPMLKIEQGIQAFARAKVILTDRLHASILAFLMDKPHVIVDNIYGKISKTRDMAFLGSESCQSDRIRGYMTQNIQQALEKVVEVLNKL